MCAHDHAYPMKGGSMTSSHMPQSSVVESEEEYLAWLHDRLELAAEKLQDLQLGTDACTLRRKEEAKFVADDIVARQNLDLGDGSLGSSRCLLEELVKQFLIAKHPMPSYSDI